jgi:hypothetical protein
MGFLWIEPREQREESREQRRREEERREKRAGSRFANPRRRVGRRREWWEGEVVKWVWCACFLVGFG